MPTLMLFLLFAFWVPVCRAQEIPALVRAEAAEKLGIRWELVGVREHTAGGQKVVRVRQRLINAGHRSWWLPSRGAPAEPICTSRSLLAGRWQADAAVPRPAEPRVFELRAGEALTFEVEGAPGAESVQACLYLWRSPSDAQSEFACWSPPVAFADIH